MKKALIAMSGGVDSSVAALLMKNQGYDCVGCTMRLFENADAGVATEKSCCSLDDVEDARSVANKLKIPYYVFNFMDGFKEKVIDNFVKCYEQGLTPNPCIDCNRYLKFDQLYERAKILGCDCIVTGHYARVVQENGKYLLKKALDDSKDQSYVLYNLTAEQLAHTQFPLGELTKTQVRQIAREHGFLNANKHESQDICFVPDGDYAKIIKMHTGKDYPAGNFVDKKGNIIGRHRGIIHYTIGQRKGLGIAAPRPYYVCGINPKDNTVCLCHEEDLRYDQATIQDVNWVNGLPDATEISCQVKIRYRHQAQDATVYITGKDTAKIVFATPQRAITPGQAAVMYQGDVVLGGGRLI